MEVVIHAASPKTCLYSNLTSKMQKPRKFRAHSCFRLEGQNNKKKVEQEQVKSLNTGLNVKQDIWKLFQEAQENDHSDILYLNKQRLVALEDLNETKRENQSLLDIIEQLKVEKEANTGKDKLVIFWELMFRIDSMVRTGMVGTKEASDFRRLLLDSIVSVSHIFSGIMHKSDAELLTELRQFSVTSKKSGLYIIHICTEMAPVVSVGSLASYVTGLSRALQRKGNLVEVILPKYSSLDLYEVHQLREIESEFYSYFNGQMHTNKAWAGVVHGIGVTFIQPITHSPYFCRERVYGYSDDFERFAYFSRASLDYIVKSGKQPDVLHIHNWETAIVGPLLWDIFVKQGLEGTRILLTCHDSDSQCLEKPEKVGLCGLDPSRLHRPDRMQDDTKTHLLNVLKGGIVYSNRVVLVPSMQSKGGIIHSLPHGLESTLAAHKDKMIITPYGFDDFTWNPSQDQFLPKKYDADNMKGKAVCKLALQHQAKLTKGPSIVLVGCIFSKMSDADLENMKANIRTASRRGIQFIIMGINQLPSVNTALKSFLNELEEENVRIIEYEKGLLHLLFAGSDIILCQSFHDPVLQVPLKALKYGAAPIALNISDDKFRHVGSENTKYTHYINTSFANMSLSQALDEIKNDPLHWNMKMADAMTKDFSWDGECYDIHISAYRSMKSN